MRRPEGKKTNFLLDQYIYIELIVITKDFLFIIIKNLPATLIGVMFVIIK